MEQSSIYQMIIERGIEQGAKRNTIENILDLLGPPLRCEQRA